MTTLSNLSQDLVGEILSRVPTTCLGAVRSTCKPWYALSRDRLLCKAEASQQFLGFMVNDHRLCSLRFDLHGLHNEDGQEFANPSIKEIGTSALHNQVEVSKVFHCDGLLLCVTRDKTRLAVCNPYLGQTKWIQPRNRYHRFDNYAIGYDNNHNHKILRFLDEYDPDVEHRYFEYEIYDFKSNSWRVLDVTSYWEIEGIHRGVSLKGNTYFFAKEGMEDLDEPTETVEPLDLLLCFDFSTESFGPFLPLPFEHVIEDTGTLSCVKEEKLAALYQNTVTLEIQVWVTTRIEPSAVSWSKFLIVDMKPFTGPRYQFEVEAGSFFIDEEKKVAVVFDVEESGHYKTACIIGEDGYFKQVNLGEAVDQDESPYGRPLVCSSYYVPSLVQINQGLELLGKRKERA